MKKNPTLRTLVILGIVFLITYALADGIRYGSTTGVMMSITSLFALFVSIYLYDKLLQLKEEEEKSY
ncbi:MAG: hypothetical protein KGO92_02300 [Bacteroidota bacterium]|nr:hypothetical protein [Bacteroidota bacterium]